MFQTGTSRRQACTVGDFAAELAKTTDSLLDQLRAAGVEKTGADDFLSEEDKQQLLQYLQSEHGAGVRRPRITLVRNSAPRCVDKKAAPQREKVFLVGNVGRAQLLGVGAVGGAILEVLAELGARLFGSTPQETTRANHRDAWRRLREALKTLRTSKAIERVHVNSLEPILRSIDPLRRTSAFFHALKVDARNTP